MPTKNPRINVTLEPHRHDLLRRMASVTQQSMSAILVDMFESIAPVFERAVVVAEQAAAARGDVKDGIRRAAEEAEQQLMPLLAGATNQLQMFMEDVQRQTGAPGGVPARDDPASPRHVRVVALEAGSGGASARARSPRSPKTALRLGTTGRKSAQPAAAAKRKRRVPDPRPVITGVRSPKKGQKKGRKR